MEMNNTTKTCSSAQQGAPVSATTYTFEYNSKLDSDKTQKDDEVSEETTGHSAAGCEDALMATQERQDASHKRISLRSSRKFVRILAILPVVNLILAGSALVLAVWTTSNLNATEDLPVTDHLIQNGNKDTFDALNTTLLHQIVELNKDISISLDVMKGMILPTNKTLKYQTVSTKLDDSKPQNKIIITENGRGQIADINTQLQNMSQRLNIYSSKCESLNMTYDIDKKKVAAAVAGVLSTLKDAKANMTMMSNKVQLLWAQRAVKEDQTEHVTQNSQMDDQLKTLTNQFRSISDNLTYFSLQVSDMEQAIANTSLTTIANSIQIQKLSNDITESSNRITGHHTCPEPYVLNPVRSTCIRVVTHKESWEAAREICEGSGEYLAVFDTVPSVEWFHQYQQNRSTPAEWKENIWIGIRYIKGHGWRWQGRVTNPIYSSDPIWARGEPDYNNEQGCGYKLLAGNRVWDAPCSDTKRYLCEKLTKI